MGLRGEVRVLDVARGGAVFDLVAERRESLTLGGKGLASGDGVCVGVPGVVVGCEKARLGGESGDGDNGDLGDWLPDRDVTMRNFDGERDNERRSDLTADETST